MKIAGIVMERGSRYGMYASLLDDFRLGHVSSVLPNCPTVSATMPFTRKATGKQHDRIFGATPETVCR